MNISRRMLSLFFPLVLLLLSVGCKSQPTNLPINESSTGGLATFAPTKSVIPSTSTVAVVLPTNTSTFSPTFTPTLTPTSKPTATLAATPTLTPTMTNSSLVTGVYSGGGCLDYTQTDTKQWWLWASFTWCVEFVEIHPDGSMIFVMSWKLDDFPEWITAVSKRSDLNNPNMYLTDNLGNRYDSIVVSGDAASDINNMEKDRTYIGTFTFRPPKPGANRFAFHDEDTHNTIENIVLDKPSVYIYNISLKWSPLTITYYTDKWKASTTDQGGFLLTHTKYTNCQVMEWEPGAPQGKLRNTTAIGNYTYDLYSTQEPDWSLREYVLVGGLENAKLSEKPLFHVTVPFDNSVACLNDMSSILASVRLISP